MRLFFGRLFLEEAANSRFDFSELAGVFGDDDTKSGPDIPSPYDLRNWSPAVNGRGYFSSYRWCDSGNVCGLAIAYPVSSRLASALEGEVKS